MRVSQECRNLIHCFATFRRCQSCDDEDDKINDDPLPIPPSPSSAGRGFSPLLALSRSCLSSTYPSSTVDGYTGHDSAAAVLSFASAFIACSRSNSVAQPATSSACCTHSPRRVCRMHRAQLLRNRLLSSCFGDHLHLHLIPSHRLVSHELSSVSLPHILLHLSIPRFPSHGGGCFPHAHYIHMGRLTRFLRFACVGSIARLVFDIALRLAVHPTDRLPPAASCSAASLPLPFFYYYGFKRNGFLSHNLSSTLITRPEYCPLTSFGTVAFTTAFDQPTYLPNATIYGFPCL